MTTPTTPAPVAQPENRKPVVLATTNPLHEFVVHADADGKGEPITITAAGVALSKADAKRVLDAATATGADLVDLTEKD